MRYSLPGFLSKSNTVNSVVIRNSLYFTAVSGHLMPSNSFSIVTHCVICHAVIIISQSIRPTVGIDNESNLFASQ